MSADGVWVPFRPTAEDLTRITGDVAEVATIQRRLAASCPALHGNDWVAHEYQVAGGSVLLRIANELPQALDGLGLFHPVRSTKAFAAFRPGSARHTARSQPRLPRPHGGV